MFHWKEPPIEQAADMHSLAALYSTGTDKDRKDGCHCASSENREICIERSGSGKNRTTLAGSFSQIGYSKVEYFETGT